MTIKQKLFYSFTLRKPQKTIMLELYQSILVMNITDVKTQDVIIIISIATTKARDEGVGLINIKSI